MAYCRQDIAVWSSKKLRWEYIDVNTRKRGSCCVCLTCLSQTKLQMVGTNFKVPSLKNSA